MTDMTNSTTRTFVLRGRRYDESAKPRRATITTCTMGCVCIKTTAPHGMRRIALDIDFADIEPLIVVLRAAAAEAAQRLRETEAWCSASALVYEAQQRAAHAD